MNTDKNIKQDQIKDFQQLAPVIIFAKKRCDKVKKLFEISIEYGLETDIILESDFPQILQKINMEYSHYTLPIAFYNGKFVGGFTDFKKFVLYFRDNLQFNCDTSQRVLERNDCRNSQQITQQRNKMTENHYKNELLFNQQHKKKQQQKRKLEYGRDNFSIIQFYKEQEKLLETQTWYGEKKIMYFQDESFVTYYDNLEYEDQSFFSQIPILILSGFPSFTYEWRNLQEKLGKNTCRIIHFLQPGLDGQDERRGKFQGYVFDNVLLLRNFIQKLGFRKVILAVHSFGNFLMTAFTSIYPNYVVSIISLACLGLYPSNTDKQIYKKGLESIGAKDLKHIQLYREKLHQISNSQELRNNLQQAIECKNVNIEYNIYEISVMAKQGNIQYFCMAIYLYSIFRNAFVYRGQFNEIFTNIENTARKLRFMAHGVDDHLTPIDLAISGMEHFAFGQGRNSNFMFMFEGSGHSVHRQNAQQLNVPLLVFIALSEALLIDLPNPKL